MDEFETGLRFIMGMYDHQVKFPEDVLERIGFYSTDHKNEANEAVFALFKNRFAKWIVGEGEPDGAVMGWKMGSGNARVLRAELFLHSMTDSCLLPTNPMSKFKVSIVPTKENTEFLPVL